VQVKGRERISESNREQSVRRRKNKELVEGEVTKISKRVAKFPEKRGRSAAATCTDKSQTDMRRQDVKKGTGGIRLDWPRKVRTNDSSKRDRQQLRSQEA